MEELIGPEDYRGKFSDKRLDKRASYLSTALFIGGSCSIHGITCNEAAQKGAYRFLSNDKVEESSLIEAITQSSQGRSAGKDVLVIEDTMEAIFEDHHRRLKPNTGMGPTSNAACTGFFMHVSLVMDSSRQTALGFSDIQVWNREQNAPNRFKRDYKKLPLQQKESNKWIKACEQSKKLLTQADSITFIEDREGDIYEQFALIADERTHLLIRSRDNRCLSGGTKLFERLAEQPLAGSYTVLVAGDIRKGIKTRSAQVEVRYCGVRLKKPKRVKTPGMPGEVSLYAVEVREVNVPEGVSEPILWRLLTTHAVENYQQALDIIHKYRLRWYIEQLFRLLKNKGFRIESSELETGWAIRRLSIMAVHAALRVLQLLLAFRSEESQPIEQVFDAGEVKCLQALNEGLQGATQKNKNSHDPKRLDWASWIIARLGGWKDYNNKRPPGPILLKKGLDKFTAIYEGWKLAQALSKN